MESGWDQGWIDRYNAILKASDKIVYVGNTPGRASFFQRDHWMVDHSSKVIGVFTGAPGGTKETIEYAKKNGREVVVINRYK